LQNKKGRVVKEVLEELKEELKMCCNNKPELARKLYRRMKKDETIFYKIYEIREITEKNGDAKHILFSPFYDFELKTFGIIKSNSKIKDVQNSKKIEREIQRGIHVYLTLKDANRWIRNIVDYGWNYERTRDIVDYGNIYKILKVTARAEDLLGVDYTSAVFTKVEITKEEFEKAKKELDRK
jgi:hypothetical protein